MPDVLVNFTSYLRSTRDYTVFNGARQFLDHYFQPVMKGGIFYVKDGLGKNLKGQNNQCLGNLKRLEKYESNTT